MSTEHVLIEKSPGPTVFVIESSSKFTLEIQSNPGEEPQTICALSAQDLVRIARNLIQIASYNVEEGEALLRQFNMDYAVESLLVR